MLLRYAAVNVPCYKTFSCLHEAQLGTALLGKALLGKADDVVINCSRASPVNPTCRVPMVCNSRIFSCNS